MNEVFRNVLLFRFPTQLYLILKQAPVWIHWNKSWHDEGKTLKEDNFEGCLCVSPAKQNCVLHFIFCRLLWEPLEMERALGSDMEHFYFAYWHAFQQDKGQWWGQHCLLVWQSTFTWAFAIHCSLKYFSKIIVTIDFYFPFGPRVHPHGSGAKYFSEA